MDIFPDFTEWWLRKLICLFSHRRGGGSYRICISISHFPFLSEKVLCFLGMKHCWFGESCRNVGENRLERYTITTCFWQFVFKFHFLVLAFLYESWVAKSFLKSFLIPYKSTRSLVSVCTILGLNKTKIIDWLSCKSNSYILSSITLT